MEEAKTTLIYDFQYLVIKCGYTSRLIKHLKDIQQFAAETIARCECEDVDGDYCKKCAEDSVVYIYQCQNFKKDNIKERLLSCGKKEDIDIVCSVLKPDQIYDSICFKVENGLQDAYNLVDHLISYRHCACFGLYPYQMELVKKEGKKILVMYFDTESG